MKIPIVLALAVFAGAMSVVAAPDQQAVVVLSSPREKVSPVVLTFADDTQCTLTGNLYREIRRDESDILPHSEWIMDISRKICPGENGDVIRIISWETRLKKAPHQGDSLSIPRRL